MPKIYLKNGLLLIKKNIINCALYSGYTVALKNGFIYYITQLTIPQYALCLLTSLSNMKKDEVPYLFAPEDELILKNRMNSSCSLNHPCAIHPILQIVLIE